MLWLCACASSGAPVDSSTQQLDMVEKLSDATWAVEFTVDSVRTGSEWTVLAPAARVTGTIAFGGRNASTALVDANIDVSFVSALGHEISCFEPGSTKVMILEGDQGWWIQFTPQSADCGFGALLRTSNSTVVGTWSETSLTGPVTAGSLRLVPVKH